MKVNISDKFGEIKRVEKPNLSSEYNRNSSSFKQSQQIENENPYLFSQNTKSIDNSNLQHSSAESFGEVQKTINDAKTDNSALGRKVIEKVKEEQDEGL